MRYRTLFRVLCRQVHGILESQIIMTHRGTVRGTRLGNGLRDSGRTCEELAMVDGVDGVGTRGPERDSRETSERS